LLDAGVNTTAWIAYLRRAAFPIAIILYVQFRRADSAVQPGTERPTSSIALGVFAAATLAAATTILTTAGHDLLPPYFVDRSELIYSYALWYQSISFALFLFAAVVLFGKRRSVLDLWLLVALVGWLVESLLTLTLHGRFTVGWYCLFVMTLFSHLVVMLALIAESNRLYARLACRPWPGSGNGKPG
jgi:hypothetical protein